MLTLAFPLINIILALVSALPARQEKNFKNNHNTFKLGIKRDGQCLLNDVSESLCFSCSYCLSWDNSDLQKKCIVLYFVCVSFEILWGGGMSQLVAYYRVCLPV